MNQPLQRKLPKKISRNSSIKKAVFTKTVVLPKILIHSPEKLVSSKGKNNQYHVFPEEVRDRAYATSINKGT